LKNNTPKKKRNNKKKKKGGVCGEPSPGKGAGGKGKSKNVSEVSNDKSEVSNDKSERSESKVKWCKNDFMFQEFVKSDMGSVRQYLTGDEKPCNGTIYSLMQQISMAIVFAYDYCEFTHYDLHSDNVLMRSTEYPHKLYIPRIGKPLYLKTFGVEPVIIDTGYSYANVLEGEPLDTCIHNVHLGYTSHTSEKHYDLRMWLLNVIEDYPDGNKESAHKLEAYFKKFKELYRKHHMTPHGWFRSETDMDGINAELSDAIENAAPRRSVLYTKTSDTLLSIGHLITLPIIEEENYFDESEKEFMGNMKSLWGTISKCFWTCENKLGTGTNVRLYFWKKVIEFAREPRGEFKEKCLAFLSEYSVKIADNAVNFDDLYSALQDFADRYKHLILEYHERIDEVRRDEDRKTKSPMEIIKLMEYVYRSSHKIKSGEIVRVHSAKHRKSVDLTLTDDQIEEVNKCSNSDGKAEYLSGLVEVVEVVE
jgi:hypothetical protein